MNLLRERVWVGRIKKPIIRRAIATSILAAGLSAAGLSQASGAVVETRYLVASDATGTLSHDRLRSLADQAQAMLERILAFWSADSGTGRFGKIHVIFDAPRNGGYASVFFWERGDRERRRAVRVFGFEKSPEMMAHKLTSAVFAQRDKLIRNMMGILTEMQIGNPLTFPMCGFSSDDWVRAFLNTGSYIALDDLGPDHESWGMRFAEGGQVSVFDRAKQHEAYAEAGSFGIYLFRKYGIDKLKQLQRLSQHQKRPVEEVFGATLGDLEANWLAALRTNGKMGRNNVSILTRLIEKNTSTACIEARQLVTDER